MRSLASLPMATTRKAREHLSNTPDVPTQRADGTFAAPLVPKLRPVLRSKVYTDIVEQILENVQAGTFPPGERLPPERLLAERLGVSRASLREAVRVLEHAGVVDVRGGSGTYVTHDSLSQATTLRTRATLRGEHSPLDLIIVRIAIEPLAAELAASSHYLKDIRSLHESLTHHRAAIDNNQDPSAADSAFHAAVAVASHNDVMLDVENYFTELMHQRTWTDLKHMSRSRHNELFLAQHTAVFNAIVARNSSAAASAMLDHLKTIQTDFISEVPHMQQTDTIDE